MACFLKVQNNMLRPTKYATFFITMVLIPAIFLYASPTLKDLGLPKSFILKSEFYAVDSVKEAREPGFLSFHVTAPHGSYDAEGLLALQKLLHEIQVIEMVKRNKSEGGFFDGAADSVEATGEGFVNLVTHPVKSVEGVGKATGKIGRGIGGMFRKKEEGEKKSFGEKMLGGSEREIAKELNVDVYTTNVYLQELLERTARARMGGKGAVMVAKFFLPIAGVASMVITASGVNSAADQLANDTDRTELFRLNKNALVNLGFDEEAVRDLLNLPYYSPRETTYLRFYLENLKFADNYQEIFKTALSANSFQEARKILYAAQIAAEAVPEFPKFQRIECFKEGIAIQEADKIVFIVPYDYLDQSHLGGQVLKYISELKQKWSKSSAEIWNGGKVTPGFSSTALLKGVKIRDWLLFKEAK